MIPHEHLDECPYGAGNCPKVESLKKLMEKNIRDLETVNNNVIALTTTIKNTSFFIGIAVTVASALIGVYLI